MANMKFNPILRRIRGKLGNYVFRKQRGKLVISTAPDFPSTPPTAPQLAVREAFRQAAAYAKDILTDPAQRQVYERLADERRMPVLSVVVGDYLNPPVVDAITLDAYHGRVGDRIVVTARDDIEVVSVKVSVFDRTAQAVVEDGNAVKTQGVWVYTATTALPAGHAADIEARAYDRPNHEGLNTVAYP